MDVVVLKLLTSEEIIAELVKQDDEKITILRPVYLVVNPQTGQGSFQPFLMASNLHDEENPKQLSVLRDKLLIPIQEVSQTTGDQYQALFSKIVTPHTAIIQ